uniref:Uncharacterized protein n=1 Tax=Anguilla anguilla TaxID=7936 RepID=A0A0E9SYT6_ANGAN
MIHRLLRLGKTAHVTHLVQSHISACFFFPKEKLTHPVSDK